MAKKVNNEKPLKQLVVLTNGKKSSKSLEQIVKSCKDKGFTCKLIKIKESILKFDKNNVKCVIDDNQKKPLEIEPSSTAILCRRGVIYNTYTRDIVRQLEDAGFYVVNKLTSILDCENKYLTLKKLEMAGIEVPKYSLVHNINYLDNAIEEVGGKYPIVMKLLSGTQGIGVSIVNSYESLKSVIQTLWALDKSCEVLLQEMIETDYDLRVHVLSRGFKPKGDKKDSYVIAAMKRTKADKDFRTNYSIGGSVEKVTLTEEQNEIAIKATKILGCRWAGVDIIVDDKTGKNYVLEVNASSGTEGITKASGINVAEQVVKFMMNRDNWIRTRKEVGFLESIKINGIGQFVARFDTGNGAKACSIHADSIDIDEKKKVVKWTIKDKKIEHKLEGYTTAITGQVKDRRPMILMDIEFLGKLYKKVLVSPVLRHNKTAPFLVNRNFMDLAQVLVNPQKIFINTSFEEFDKTVKGNHNGIVLESKLLKFNQKY